MAGGGCALGDLRRACHRCGASRTRQHGAARVVVSTEGLAQREGRHRACRRARGAAPRRGLGRPLCRGICCGMLGRLLGRGPALVPSGARRRGVAARTGYTFSRNCAGAAGSGASAGGCSSGGAAAGAVGAVVVVGWARRDGLALAKAGGARRRSSANRTRFTSVVSAVVVSSAVVVVSSAVSVAVSSVAVSVAAAVSAVVAVVIC